jgi:hypothetical protein
MDRDEAIQLLKGGSDRIREWNKWRRRRGKLPDLSGSNFRVADLRGADLRRADLSGADLRLADLRLADLSGAALSEAKCFATTFGSIDLSEVRGLESIRHEGPSSVDVDTLVSSKGRIHEAFLRGCGVPEAWIEYLPSLLGMVEPIQFYSCFISYSTKDEGFAKRLHSRMVQEKLRVWFAPEDIQGGKKIHKQIDEAIRGYDSCSWSSRRTASAASGSATRSAGRARPKSGKGVASSSRSGSWVTRSWGGGRASMRTWPRTWPRRSASITSPTSPTGRITTRSRRRSPG